MADKIHRLKDHRSGPPALCVLASGDRQWTGRLRRLTADGAILETVARPEIGSEALLLHPEVGGIVAEVESHSRRGVGLAFVLTEESAAFAIAVTAHDMTVAATG